MQNNLKGPSFYVKQRLHRFRSRYMLGYQERANFIYTDSFNIHQNRVAFRL